MQNRQASPQKFFSTTQKNKQPSFSIQILSKEIDSFKDAMKGIASDYIDPVLDNLKAAIQKLQQKTGADKHPWTSLACVLNDVPVALMLAYSLYTGDTDSLGSYMMYSLIPAWNSLCLHGALYEPRTALINSWLMKLPTAILGYFGGVREYLFTKGKPEAKNHYAVVATFVTLNTHNELRHLYEEQMREDLYSLDFYFPSAYGLVMQAVQHGVESLFGVDFAKYDI